MFVAHNSSRKTYRSTQSEGFVCRDPFMTKFEKWWDHVKFNVITVTTCDIPEEYKRRWWPPIFKVRAIKSGTDVRAYISCDFRANGFGNVLSVTTAARFYWNIHSDLMNRGRPANIKTIEFDIVKYFKKQIYKFKKIIFIISGLITCSRSWNTNIEQRLIRGDNGVNCPLCSKKKKNVLCIYTRKKTEWL